MTAGIDIKTADFYDKCQFFASARAGARRGNAGPDHGWATKYYSTLGGVGVRPKEAPPFGYSTRAEAIEGARQFKVACQDALRRGAPNN